MGIDYAMRQETLSIKHPWGTIASSIIHHNTYFLLDKNFHLKVYPSLWQIFNFYGINQP